MEGHQVALTAASLAIGYVGHHTKINGIWWLGLFLFILSVGMMFDIQGAQGVWDSLVGFFSFFI